MIDVDDRIESLRLYVIVGDNEDSTLILDVPLADDSPDAVQTAIVRGLAYAGSAEVMGVWGPVVVAERNRLQSKKATESPPN